MARRKRERMSEGKKRIIAGLLREYDIKIVAEYSGSIKRLARRYYSGNTQSGARRAFRL